MQLRILRTQVCIRRMSVFWKNFIFCFLSLIFLQKHVGIQTVCNEELIFTLLEFKNCIAGILLAAERDVCMSWWLLVDRFYWFGKTSVLPVIWAVPLGSLSHFSLIFLYPAPLCAVSQMASGRTEGERNSLDLVVTVDSEGIVMSWWQCPGFLHFVCSALSVSCGNLTFCCCLLLMSVADGLWSILFPVGKDHMGSSLLWLPVLFLMEFSSSLRLCPVSRVAPWPACTLSLSPAAVGLLTLGTKGLWGFC